MPLNLIIYLLLLTLCSAGAAVTGNAIGYTPLLFLLLLAPLDLFCAIHARRSLTACGSPGLKVLERGKSAKMPFSYESRSRIFVCRMRLAFILAGPKGSSRCSSKSELTVAQKGKSALSFRITPRHVGVYRVQLKRAYACGPLGLFCFRLPIRQAGMLIVTPAPIEWIGDMPEGAGSELPETTALATTSGSDADKYSGAREYEPSDSMRSIHWKLTAHQMKFMTRVYENDESTYLTVMADLRPSSRNAKMQLAFHDKVCEAAFTALSSCVEQGEQVRLALADGDRLRSVTVKSSDDLLTAANTLAEVAETVDMQFSPFEVKGALPEGAVIAVTGKLDPQIAGYLCDCCSNSIYIYVASPGFKREDAASFFDHLNEHDVTSLILHAEYGRRLPRESLEILNGIRQKGRLSEA